MLVESVQARLLNNFTKVFQEALKMPYEMALTVFSHPFSKTCTKTLEGIPEQR